jgi:hypothetical protein
MKRKLIAACVLSILWSTVAAAETTRTKLSCSVTWNGREAWVEFNDETFNGKPVWIEEDRNEPPLSMAQAVHIAKEYIRTNKADQLMYSIQSVNLNRYLHTDHWYYTVHFVAVVPERDHSWRLQEPYAQLLASGEYWQDANLPPQLDIAILMSGDVMPARIVRFRSQPAAGGDRLARPGGSSNEKEKSAGDAEGGPSSKPRATP